MSHDASPHPVADSPTMNRIDACFAQLRQQNRKAFVVYLCAGDPHLDATVDLVVAAAEAGADVIELGVPYSDPMADGPANQAASERALAAGANLAGVLAAVAQIRQRSSVPILLFTYLAPVLAFGRERFAIEAVAAGVDGVLPLDLPPEEDPALRQAWQEVGLSTVCLIAPNTTPARRALLAEASSGFVYYVCRFGVTGEQSSLPDDVAEQVATIRQHSTAPVCVGFGISSPEQAAAAASAGDGAIVGSHLVRLIERHGQDDDLVDRLGQRIAEMAAAVHAVDQPSLDACE